MFTITRAINMLIDLSWASGFHSVSAYLRSRNSQFMWERFTSSALPVRLGTGSFSVRVPPPTQPGNETSETLSKKNLRTFANHFSSIPSSPGHSQILSHSQEKPPRDDLGTWLLLYSVQMLLLHVNSDLQYVVLPWKPDVQERVIESY